MEIGGFTKNINDEGVCYYCRLREGNNRWFKKFLCDAREKKNLYYNIIYYNKFEECYLSHSSSDKFGNPREHNCLSCRESSLYYLEKYSIDGPEGNCISYTHKCR